MNRFDERNPMTAEECGKPIPGEPDALKGCVVVRSVESLLQTGGA
jgi:hypothetical protein